MNLFDALMTDQSKSKNQEFEDNASINQQQRQDLYEALKVIVKNESAEKKAQSQKDVDRPARDLSLIDNSFDRPIKV